VIVTVKADGDGVNVWLSIEDPEGTPEASTEAFIIGIGATEREALTDAHAALYAVTKSLGDQLRALDGGAADDAALAAVYMASFEADGVRRP